MKSNIIFIGNIMKCVKFETKIIYNSEIDENNKNFGYEFFGCNISEDEVYKENAILIKLKNGKYVNLENINTIFDYLKLNQILPNDKSYIGKIIMNTESKKINDLFVDEKSLKPYKLENKNISILKLKRENM